MKVSAGNTYIARFRAKGDQGRHVQLSLGKGDDPDSDIAGLV